MGEVPHVQPRPQDPNSWQLGPRGLKGVMAHALPHLNKNTNIYILTYDFIVVSRGETKKRKKKEGLSPMDRRRSPALLTSALR
jgi:hypothetical protein